MCARTLLYRARGLCQRACLASRSELSLSLDVDRAKHWIDKGARPSETVHSIFQRQGVYQDRPQRKRRERPGRKRLTKTRANRRSAQKARAQRKSLKGKKSAK